MARNIAHTDETLHAPRTMSQCQRNKSFWTWSSAPSFLAGICPLLQGGVVGEGGFQIPTVKMSGYLNESCVLGFNGLRGFAQSAKCLRILNHNWNTGQRLREGLLKFLPLQLMSGTKIETDDSVEQPPQRLWHQSHALHSR